MRSDVPVVDGPAVCFLALGPGQQSSHGSTVISFPFTAVASPLKKSLPQLLGL